MGARAIPPPSDLYTMKEHDGSGSEDEDENSKEDRYAGSGLSKEDKMKLLEIAKACAITCDELK